MNRIFTIVLVLAMVLGIVVGLVSHSALTPDQTKSFTDILCLVTTIFLRLIKMIIAPLVFSTLVAGIAHMGDIAALGRVGIRSIA
ncbi:MAG: cation:dicarboxylase symporter family transporter, partial [Alphaproteobacteria bacterium]|nr:cation:dicarboxylase symporter family transporter [Alphaproteobacteria bacterium]